MTTEITNVSVEETTKEITKETTEATTKKIENASEELEIVTTETHEVIGVETFPVDNDQVDNMLYTLPMMGKGMLGIFIVTLIIIASVAILNKVTGCKKKEQ